MAAALEERLSDVGPGAEAGGATAVTIGVEEEGNRAARLPRWSRQEILVLIQGKRVAENRVRRGLGFGSGQVEPKWASVSSYCKRHGVNRGPVQCRKRWSNLAGDFKKIKEWETCCSSSNSSRSESFWVMRNDLRRERKLPGFFDREVYDILLDSTSSSLPLPDNSSSLLVLPLPEPQPEPQDDQDTETEELVFDSSRTGAAADDALFSDFELSPPSTSTKLNHPPPPFSDKQHPPQQASAQGASHVKQPPKNPEVGTATQEGLKRKRLAIDGEEETYLENQLIKTLERNGKLLSSQLEIQNVNFQLDREQRKDHGNSLIAVLNKLADALGRIADKL